MAANSLVVTEVHTNVETTTEDLGHRIHCSSLNCIYNCLQITAILKLKVYLKIYITWNSSMAMLDKFDVTIQVRLKTKLKCKINYKLSNSS